jgi:small conductance mechanosensitive channel
MVVKGQIKTRPLQQWSVARAFNLRIKRKMDEAGMQIPVPQMQVQMSRDASDSREADAKSKRIWIDEEEAADAADAPRAVALDVSHEPRPAPPATDHSVQIPPQIPTAPEPGKG